MYYIKSLDSNFDTNELLKASKAVYIAIDKEIADHLSNLLATSASEIDLLRKDLKVMVNMLEGNQMNCDKYI